MTLWIIAHSKLFVKNFFRRREISGFPRLSLNYRTAAMPCLYWFRLCVPLTAVSGRPVSQSVTNSILDGFPSVLCRFRRLRPVNAVRRSRRRVIDCLHDTICRAVCQQVFFAFLAPFGFLIRFSPLFRTFLRRFLCLISDFSAFLEL